MGQELMHMGIMGQVGCTTQEGHIHPRGCEKRMDDVQILQNLSPRILIRKPANSAPKDTALGILNQSSGNIRSMGFTRHPRKDGPQ